MTQDEFDIEIIDAANYWQNKGCIEGMPMFENARTRWAALDFISGADK